MIPVNPGIGHLLGDRRVSARSHCSRQSVGSSGGDDGRGRGGKDRQLRGRGVADGDIYAGSRFDTSSTRHDVGDGDIGSQIVNTLANMSDVSVHWPPR